MEHKGAKVALAGAAVVAAGLSVAAAEGFRMAVVRRDVTEEEQDRHLSHGFYKDYQEEIREGVRWFRAQEPEAVSIRSRDGLKLRGSYLEAPNARACMLLCHGYRSRGELDFGVVLRLFYEQGCSVLVIDQRAHGRSEGKYISYGVLERYDCQQWAWFLHAKLGGRLPIFLEGMSMGAATVMMASDLALPPSVAGVIADCGYSSPWEELRHCMKVRYHLSSFPVLELVDLLCRTRGGFSLKGSSAVQSLANSPLPLLLIHGADDDFVPAAMAAENYAAAAGEKRQILVPGARHAASYLLDRERVRRELLDFVAEYGGDTMGHKKLRILYIARLLLERTDEDHTVTVKDIIAHMEGLGIQAERKAIYDDLDLLEQFGMDIVRTKTKTFNVYLGSRTFQLPELKMLVDVVQASPFLTQKKSMELIGKLETLTSRPQAAGLRRQVYVMDRIKTPNEQLYYHIDAINQAISTGRQITFRYFDWGVDRQRTYRHGGARYAVNPVALCVEKYYYLVAYDPHRGYVHYRVDRMNDVEVSDAPRAKLPPDFDLAKYVKGIFDMYHGERTAVTLELDRSLLNVAMDRFGQDAHIRSGEGDAVVVSAMVEVSPTFLSWVMGFGSKMRITAPASARQALVDLCREALEQYI